jgi:arsenate reductase
MKKSVLFLCIHNSARSQIAEGLMNHFFGDRYKAYSAGTEATFVKPLAIEALRRVGVDISGHYSKTVEALAGVAIETVVTVCAEGAEACPFVPGAKEYIHWSLKDPSSVVGSKAEKLAAFEATREEIKRLMVVTFKEDKTE